MTKRTRLPDSVERPLRWPLRLTRAGMVSERITRAFWPVWTFLIATCSALGFRLHESVSAGLWPAVAVVIALGVVGAFLFGMRRFRWPTQDEAMDRLDSILPGRPLAALSDQQAIGLTDPGSRSVWGIHLERMASRARLARPAPPDLRIAALDPFALRYVALVAFIVALLFGSLLDVAELVRPGRGAVASVAQATWEGWAEPPAHTRKPRIYLPDTTSDRIDLPQGSRIVIRLYDPNGTLAVKQSLADSPSAPSDQSTNDRSKAGMPLDQEIIASRSGRLAILGDGGREWAVNVITDRSPSVSFAGPMRRLTNGTMRQPFAAMDDYGIAKGEVRFDLDLSSVDRRYGLATEPESTEPLVFDLPLPISGKRDQVREVLLEDASEHPWANLPVKATLWVTDGLGQSGHSETIAMDLPGRRFFDPVAAAVIEMRRDLLWSRQNAHRVTQVLRAITSHPEGTFREERAYLLLRTAIRQLGADRNQPPMEKSVRDDVARGLWEAALLIEDGGIDDAFERMKAAQERLSEAIRKGASPDEIQKLMDDLREASDAYLRKLAEQQRQDPADRFTQDQPEQTITQDQIQQMMDEIQKLMEAGKMAEAQALLEQFNRLLENLKVTQGDGGEGQSQGAGPDNRDLGQTLRQQQELSDDAFRQHQRQFDPQGTDPQRGTRPGQDRKQNGRSGTDQPAEDGNTDSTLADRQRALRNELGNQQQNLPDGGGQDGNTVRRLLDEAGRAMKEAEQALREGQTSDAIERQAEAIDRLREGIRQLGKNGSANEDRKPGSQGQSQSNSSQQQSRDPLGREEGSGGGVGDTDSDIVNRKDGYRRARDLLDEIRRRAADQSRSATERDYLDRLMDLF